MKLFDAKQSIATAEVWKGAKSTVTLTSLTPIVVTVPRGDAAKLQTQLNRTDPLLAPLAVGQKLGTLKVISGRQVVAEVPVTVAEPVPMAGLFGRLWDGLRLMIK